MTTCDNCTHALYNTEWHRQTIDGGGPMWRCTHPDMPKNRHGMCQSIGREYRYGLRSKLCPLKDGAFACPHCGKFITANSTIYINDKQGGGAK